MNETLINAFIDTSANFTINDTGWQGMADVMPGQVISNPRFLMNFCDALHSSIDKAIMLILFGFLMATLFQWLASKINYDKLCDETEWEWLKEVIRQIPLMIRNVGFIFIILGCYYLLFLRYYGGL